MHWETINMMDNGNKANLMEKEFKKFKISFVMKVISHMENGLVLDNLLY